MNAFLTYNWAWRFFWKGRMRFALTKMGEGAIYWKGRQCHLGATTRVALTKMVVWAICWERATTRVARTKEGANAIRPYNGCYFFRLSTALLAALRSAVVVISLPTAPFIHCCGMMRPCVNILFTSSAKFFPSTCSSIWN